MNWSLVKKDFMLLLKSPLTYIGVLSMVVILYITVSPYIKLYDDFQPDGETMEYSYDGNITDGYIPTPENERWEYVSQEMEAYLVSECEMSHEDAQKQMDEVLSKGWTVQEIRQFFIDEYGIVGFQSVWNMSAYKKADAGEVQQYLDSGRIIYELFGKKICGLSRNHFYTFHNICFCNFAYARHEEKHLQFYSYETDQQPELCSGQIYCWNLNGLTLCCYTNSDCRCCRCKCRKQLWIQNKPLGYLGQYHNV